MPADFEVGIEKEKEASRLSLICSRGALIASLSFFKFTEKGEGLHILNKLGGEV